MDSRAYGGTIRGRWRGCGGAGAGAGALTVYLDDNDSWVNAEGVSAEEREELAKLESELLLSAAGQGWAAGIPEPGSKEI